MCSRKWLSKNAFVKRGDYLCENNIWEQYHKTSDPSLKEQLVLEHLSLVKYLAGRLAVSAPPTMTQDDLEGYGVIGLLDAIEKYNTTWGTEFKNYAYTRVRGAILDEIRKQNWVPRSKWQKFSQLNKTKEQLWKKNGLFDEQTLAKEMGVDKTKLRLLAAEYKNAFPVSLDEAIGPGNEGVVAETIRDHNSPDPLEIITERDEKETLIEAINELQERDRLVLSLYYHEELTLKEIGRIMEVTESRVCQLHAKALKKLKDKLTCYMGYANDYQKGARL